jgi:phage terminase large subunit-like protein
MAGSTRLTAQTLRDLPDNKVKDLLEQLGPSKVEELQHTWSFWARDEQLEPDGDWNTWFINAGRGFGKTRAGVEWVRSQVKGGVKRIAAVAATNSDIERVSPFACGRSAVAAMVRVVCLVRNQRGM